MNLLKQHLTAYLCASKDTTRPALMNVKIEPGKVCATDGSIAVKMEFEGSKDIPAGAPDMAFSPTEPVLVPVDAIKAILKGSKASDTFDLLVNTNSSMGYLINGGATVSFTLSDERYPDIDAVYPQDTDTEPDGENYNMTAFNPAYLETINKLYKPFGLSTYGSAVSVVARGDCKASSFQWTGNGTAVHVILMPVRKV